MKFKQASLPVVFIALTQVLAAHPSGHSGDAKETAVHLFTSPDHLLVFAGLALLALATTAIFIRKKSRAAKK